MVKAGWDARTSALLIIYTELDGWHTELYSLYPGSRIRWRRYGSIDRTRTLTAIPPFNCTDSTSNVWDRSTLKAFSGSENPVQGVCDLASLSGGIVDGLTFRNLDEQDTGIHHRCHVNPLLLESSFLLCLSAVGDDASELSGAETDRYGTLYNRILREPRPAINACDEQCLCAKGFNVQVQSVCCRLYDSDGEAWQHTPSKDTTEAK